MNRFERQTNLRGLGIKGQNKLRNAAVLVVGAGGLGCPAMIYLAASGVGKIAILDGDRISVSNLNRQVLFGRGDEGQLKAEVAAKHLTDQYCDSEYLSLPFFLTSENAAEIMGDYDLILDCSDNFPTRYLINDTCVLLGKPFIQGAIYEDEGQVAVFNLSQKGQASCHYRDLYPAPPAAGLIPDCNKTGVLGVLPGVIGTLQASEAIKIITHRGISLADNILFVNLYSNENYLMEIRPKTDSRAKMPSDLEELRSWNYQIEPKTGMEVSWSVARNWLRNDPEKVVLIDVREPQETPRLNHPTSLSVPMSHIEKQQGKLEKYKRILFFCSSGQRSLLAANKMADQLKGCELYSIKGGISQSDSPINASEKWKRN